MCIYVFLLSNCSETNKLKGCLSFKTFNIQALSNVHLIIKHSYMSEMSTSFEVSTQNNCHYLTANYNTKSINEILFFKNHYRAAVRFTKHKPKVDIGISKSGILRQATFQSQLKFLKEGLPGWLSW